LIFIYFLLEGWAMPNKTTMLIECYLWAQATPDYSQLSFNMGNITVKAFNLP